MGVLFITHDLGVVAELCHRVTVLYAGQVVERSSVAGVFSEPQHPYTEGLLGSIHTDDDTPLGWIEGQPPRAGAMPPGCRFHPRCPYAEARCAEGPVSLVDTGCGHLSRCVRVTELTLAGRA
jgi:oligopeptide/dipeptide ABC transporter ATP-binding protein